MVVVRSLIVAVAFVVLFEAGARLGGWLDPTLRPDPYLGFPGTSDIFRVERDAGGDEVYRRSPNKAMYLDTSFPVDKSPGEFRVFCVGGSNVRGDYGGTVESSFPSMLDVYLNGALTAGSARVVNVGGGAMGSIQNTEAVREVVGYDADLVIVYPDVGQKNCVAPAPEGLLAASDDESPIKPLLRRHLAQSRLYVGIRDGYRALLRPHPNDDRHSVFAAFALWAVSRPFGPESFTRLFDLKKDRVPPLMASPIPTAEIERAKRRFVDNLVTMASTAQARGVAIVFVIPVRNHRLPLNLRFHVDPAEIRDGELDAWRSHYEAGLAAKRAGRDDEALAELLAVRACYVDDRDEILAFYLGEVYEALGRMDDARHEFELPYLRHPTRELVVEAGRAAGVPVIDPYPLVKQGATDGIPGYNEFTDGFHSNPKTNWFIARSILNTLRDEHIAPPLNESKTPKMQQARGRIQQLIRDTPPPHHTLMVRALLDEDYDQVIALGEDYGGDGIIERLYFGYALTKRGQLERARALHDQLRTEYGPRRLRDVPAMELDEDIVINAFRGDVFAYF